MAKSSENDDSLDWLDEQRSQPEQSDSNKKRTNPVGSQTNPVDSKNDHSEKVTEPVFMVDPAVELWIEEDTKAVRPRKRQLNQKAKRKRSLWGIFTTLFFIVTLLLVAALVTLWFSRGWLINKAEEKAITALDAEGVFLTYEARDYRFPQGLVFENVTIFETAAREVPSLKLSNFGINLDVWHLLSKRSAEGLQAAVTTEKATAELFSKGEKIGIISELDADLFATSELLELNRLRGTLNGLDFDVEGTVDLPEPPAETDSAPNEPTNDDPPAEGPLLDFSPLVSVFEEIQFSKTGEKNPKLEADIFIDTTADAATPVKATGRFSGGAFSWKELALDSAALEFETDLENGFIHVPSVSIVYKGGTLSGKFTYALNANSLEVARFSSNANLIDLAAEFDPTIRDSVAGIEFADMPEISASGTLNLTDLWSSENLILDYRHWKGLVVSGVPISKMNGRLKFQDGRMTTEEFTANVYDGAVRLAGTISPNVEGFPFQATANVQRMSLAKIETDLPGLLTMDFQGAGSVTDLSKLQGKGSVRVDGGKFYTIPVLGGIQKLLAELIPLFGNPDRTALTATYSVAYGKLTTPDLLLRSDGTKVKVDGSLDLTNMTTVCDVKANLDGPLGIATGVVAEALTLEVTGPLSKPMISPKNVPEALSNLAGGVGDVLGAGVGALQNLGGGNAEPPPTSESQPPPEN